MMNYYTLLTLPLGVGNCKLCRKKRLIVNISLLLTDNRSFLGLTALFFIYYTDSTPI